MTTDANNFHNMSDAMIADKIGTMDAHLKALEEVLKPYKDEFKRRGLTAVRGEKYVVTASTSTSKRLDTKKLRDALGDALDGYEIESTSTRILIKFAPQLTVVE